MKKSIATFFLTMLLCAPFAHAQMGEEGGPRGEGQHKGKGIEKMFEKLNLSEEQKKMIEANRAKNKGAKKALMDAIKANMDVLGEELKKPELDMAKLNALHEQQKQLINQMSDQRFNSILEVRKILTKEQFVKFTEMLQKKMMRNPFFKEHGMNTDKP